MSKFLVSPTVFFFLFLFGCSSLDSDSVDAGGNTSQGQLGRMADLHIVDCLLPGQVRMLGNNPYMSPRRPTRTTAADCRVRGGEYVAFDRADYKTALKVWMAAAESGDAEAQVNVGEIFEKGLGASPNYEAALIWYRKAAAQGNRRAQFNLGTMYEQGLGVAVDQLQALNWYRQAWGMPADNITYRSTVQRQLAALEAEHKKAIRQRELQINALEDQLSGLRTRIAAGSTERDAEIAELEELVASLHAEQVTASKQIEDIRVRQPALDPVAQVAPAASSTIAADVWANKVNFGKFYALVIGNQNYDKLDDLVTPVSDVDAVASLLERKYGFKVTKLVNVTNIEVMEEVNRLNDKLTSKDNLLIFYAGHGIRVASAEQESGYWLPVNSDPPPNDTYWVSNEFVTGHLARLKARRVLVIADSCYSGLLSSAPGFLMLQTHAQPDPEYVQYKAKRRSRLLLSSGGDKPVLDSGAGNHSVFAGAVLQVLEENDQLLMGPELYRQVQALTVARAKQLNFNQKPDFKVIKGAGHEVGDFFFIPANT